MTLNEKGMGPFRMATSDEVDVENRGVSALGALKFLNLVGKLKRVKRTGWVRTGVDKPESVADHMYRMSIISMLVPITCSYRDRLVKMAIVHDLAEAIVGDITPFDGVSKEEKYKREHEAMNNIRDVLLEGSPIGLEIYNLWKEYEEGVSECARVCKDIDKFEMILQASEYEREQNKDLSQFFNSTEGKFETKLVKSWVSALCTNVRK